MKIEKIKVRIKCTMCGKFDKTIDVNVNEHGFFAFPEGHCPECLCILIWEVNHHKKEE